MNVREPSLTTIGEAANTDVTGLLIDHLDLWTNAVTQKRSAGRGSNGKVELTGIKKLRELILELAVRGKLVDQEPDEEPASVLLERITEEKARLVKEGKIKKPKKLPEIDQGEIPFSIPHSWKFVRLGEAVEIVRGITFPASEKSSTPEPGRISCLRTSNIQDRVEWNDLLYIRDSFVSKSSQYIQQHDIVISMANSRELVGKVAIIEQPPTETITFGGFLGVMRPILIHPRYLMAVLRAPNARNSLIGSASQTTNIANISIGKLNPFVFGLPPLEEQQRIVHTADELMALCDRLEQQVGDHLKAHEVLVDTLLDALTRSADAAELAENWARIAEHFDTLFTTEASIDKLKQSILQLAVMGRLVPQDPNDEPASMLLEKIAEEKARLVKEGKIKKPKKLSHSDDEELASTPKGWKIIRFGELITVRSELVKAPDYPELYQVAPDSIEKGTGRLLFRRTVKESGAKGPNNKFQKGQILYSKIRPSLSKAVIAEFDGLCSADMYPIDSFIHARYLLLTILSEPFLSQVRAAENRIKMPKLNIESLSNIVVGLPPEAEQHRITDKVDELMSLCDRLRARLTEAGETRTHLAEAVVEQAVTT